MERATNGWDLTESIKVTVVVDEPLVARGGDVHARPVKFASTCFAFVAENVISGRLDQQWYGSRIPPDLRQRQPAQLLARPYRPPAYAHS